jgi:hypothetical protein
MPFGLRERIAEKSDGGAPFHELVRELDVYKDRLSQRQYDELWLFCWAVAKRRTAVPVSNLNGEPSTELG